MAERSDYVAQLGETARLVAERGAPGLPWALVYQSRSGAPTQPWLTPDIGDHIDTLAGATRARGRRRPDRVRVRPHGGHQRPRCRRGEAGRSGGHRARPSVDSGYRPRVRVDGARAHRGASRSVATAPSAGFAGRAPGRVPGLLRVTASERRRALRAPHPRRGRVAGARCPPQTAGARRVAMHAHARGTTRDP